MSAGSLASFAVTFPIREAVECRGGPLDGARVVVRSTHVSAFAWLSGAYLRRVEFRKQVRKEFDIETVNGAMTHVPKTVTSMVPVAFYGWDADATTVTALCWALPSDVEVIE